MKKSYIKPNAELVVLNLKHRVLDLGVNTGSREADPGDSFSKRGSFNMDDAGDEKDFWNSGYGEKENYLEH